MCQNNPVEFITNRGQSFKKKLIALGIPYYKSNSISQMLAENEKSNQICHSINSDNDEDFDFNFIKPSSKRKANNNHNVDVTLENLTTTRFFLQLKFEENVFKINVHYDKPFLNQMKDIAEFLNIKDEKSLIIMHKESMLSLEDSPKSLNLLQSDILDCFLIDLKKIENLNKNKNKEEKINEKDNNTNLNEKKRKSKKKKTNKKARYSSQSSKNIKYIDVEYNTEVSSLIQQCQALADHAKCTKRNKNNLKKEKEFSIELNKNDNLKSTENNVTSTFITVKFKYEGTIIKIPFDYEDCFWLHLQEIYDQFQIKSKNDLVIMHNDRVVSNDETPKSLNLTVVDILDCFIKSNSKEKKETQEANQNKNGINLTNFNYIEVKIRNNLNLKKNKIEKIRVKKDEPLINMMQNYSDLIKYSLDKMIFEFDGERLFGKETANDLEMEEDCLIDVYIQK